jgi:dissimilatory sulfite reductase (desulfoviridin) alpha/beta subunit
MKFNDIKVAYKLMKFLKSIENDTAFYDSKLVEIAQECAEKDGDKIKITENGELIVAKDKISEWNNKIVDLGNIEIEVRLPSFNIEDFSECNFTLEELSILEFLISD